MNDITESIATTEEINEGAALFTPIEARVLACLMEKQLTVPDSYPLTLNSLVLACNQKSNREPQMNLNEGKVGHTAKDLTDRGFIKIEYGDRAHKFEHNCRKKLGIDKSQQALLAVMMLRAPQTLNDLKTRTTRMTEFENLADLQQCLESLNTDQSTLMQHLPKSTGQREDRYTHLLCGKVEMSTQAIAPIAFIPPPDSDLLKHLQERISELELRVNQLESKN